MLDQFDVILLDLNATFMFGGDRFGATHDYHATYRAESGDRGSLSEVALRAAVDSCYAHLARLYHDPSRVDDFPSVAETLDALPPACDFTPHERDWIERVIAMHELGRVPDDYAAALSRLARTHRLGLISNIWSRKAPWLGELARAGVVDLFKVLVFSSDSRSMKPSQRLFDTALAAFDARRDRVVVVGDSLTADVAPACRMGLASVWINPAGAPVPPGAPQPTYVVPDLLTLVPAAR
jgi:phosphoglycolate phosphatase-like HAD superfamily hydrolase